MDGDYESSSYTLWFCVGLIAFMIVMLALVYGVGLPQP